MPAWAPVRAARDAPAWTSGPTTAPTYVPTPVPGSVDPRWGGWAGTPPTGERVPPVAPAPGGPGTSDRDGTGRNGPRRRLPVTAAAVATALVISAAVAATSLGGGTPTDDAVRPTPTTAAPTRAPDLTSLEREIGRLQVDLAVARATWAGAPQGTTPARDDLERAVDAAQDWLDAYTAPTDPQGVLRLLGEVTAHRDAVAALVAQVGQSQLAPTTAPAPTTSAPTPRATPTRSPSRASTAPRPTTAAPAPEPTTAPAPQPTTAPAPTPTSPGGEPTAPPEPTPPVEPTPPAPTDGGEPPVVPGDP